MAFVHRPARPGRKGRCRQGPAQRRGPRAGPGPARRFPRECRQMP